MMLDWRTILFCVAFKVCRVHLCQLENSKVVKELRMYNYTMANCSFQVYYMLDYMQVMFYMHMHTHCWMIELCQPHKVF